jgi:hypothetical protein
MYIQVNPYGLSTTLRFRSRKCNNLPLWKPMLQLFALLQTA